MPTVNVENTIQRQHQTLRIQFRHAHQTGIGQRCMHISILSFELLCCLDMVMAKRDGIFTPSQRLVCRGLPNIDGAGAARMEPPCGAIRDGHGTETIRCL
ncbi:MAG: hypothetical protein WCI11_19430 [Candidatus Methylumidiphilus sp.]